jgi:hypothetical protein
MACEREPHEGAWIYVSARSGQPLQSVVHVTCRRHGWPVLAADEVPSAQSTQALRLADACILDISPNGPDSGGADLALALREGRPVIALSGAPAKRAPRVEELMRTHPGVRQLSCDDIGECAAALDRLLGDPAWQRQVALAAPSG